MISLINLILGFCIFALLMRIAGCVNSDSDHKTKRSGILFCLALITVFVFLVVLAN